MFCSKCGKEISPDIIFCPYCGTKKVESNTAFNDRKIETVDYEALERRTEKVVKEFNSFPAIPSDNISYDVVANVFSFNPFCLLKKLRKSLMDMLLERTDYRIPETELKPIIESAYGKYEKKYKQKALKYYGDSFEEIMHYWTFSYTYYLDLIPVVTQIFYYSYAVFYAGKELNDIDSLLYSRRILSALTLIFCQRGDVKINGMLVRKSGKFLKLSEFEEYRTLFLNMKQMIEDEVYSRNAPNILSTMNEINKMESEALKGCYIATCVYGSYDCPQVMVLRRFRDDTLEKYALGRAFIKLYYKVSPGLVDRFGKNEKIKNAVKSVLEKFVLKLKKREQNRFTVKCNDEPDKNE